MRKPKWNLGSPGGLNNFLAFVGQLNQDGKPAIFQQVSDKRTLKQNSMFHALYGQIAQQAEDQTVSEIQCRCKLDYGVPILCAADPKFADHYERSIDHLNYEGKLIMIKYMDVTRLFDTPQGSMYIDEIIRDYSRSGYSLLHPSEQP